MKKDPAHRAHAIRNIAVFGLLVNALAWLGPVLGGSPSEPGLGFLVWAIAPLASALVVKLLLRDEVSLGMRPAFKGNGLWYVLSVLAYPVAIGGVLGLGLLLGASTVSGLTPRAFASAMIPLAATYLVFAVTEEVGWRGYLAPKIFGLNEGLLGHGLVGLIWVSWHLPYLSELWMHTSEGWPTLLPRVILGTVTFSVVYGEIRARTGSVWPAVLMHWVGNTLANTLLAGTAGQAFVALVPGREWLGSFGVAGVFMIAFFGLLGCALYVGRRAQGRANLATDVAWKTKVAS